MGLAEFRRQLDEKLDLAAYATEELRRIPGIEIVAEPELSLLAFRLRPEGIEGEALDALNRNFMESINARQRVFLTGTVVDAGFVLRICVLSFRTHRERMDQGLEHIREAAAELTERARS